MTCDISPSTWGACATTAGSWLSSQGDQIYGDWRLFLPLGIVGVLSWTVWLVRKVMSATVSPVVNDFRASTSVVVPSFHEDPDVIERCLATWLAQDPDEVIIVLDVADEEARRRLVARDDPRLHVMVFEHRGKRSALAVGIRAAQHDLLILTDSDTAWEPDLLSNVQMPFADGRVGAVSTRQNVYRPGTNVWRRIADWIIDLRYLDYVPATGRSGGVVCVSGRTAAYRREAVDPVLHDLEYEFFLGRLCIAGDDGRLTWLVLSQGWRTVHQDSARALSMFPSTFRAFCKQRIRWSRNSYRAYLTAAWRGWLWRMPVVSQVTVLQIMLTPLTMFAAVYYVAIAASGPSGWVALGLSIVWLMVGRGIRSISHLWRRPADLLLLPLVTLVVAFIALPIKTYAFVTMNKQGWLTRTDSMMGGEGQTEASLGEERQHVAA